MGVWEGGSGGKEGLRYLCTAAGSSNDPGTVCTTMFPSATPHSSSFALAPCTSGSMIVWFQRACTMATRKGEPSYFCGAGPLADMAGGGLESRGFPVSDRQFGVSGFLMMGGPFNWSFFLGGGEG